MKRRLKTSDNETIHQQFGGPVGVSAMMLGFPPLMYYLWICLVFYDGKLQGPKSFAWDDVKNFLHVFYDLAAKVSTSLFLVGYFT